MEKEIDFNNIDNSIYFDITEEWMVDRFRKLNHQLFDDMLFECHFKVFTKGKRNCVGSDFTNTGTVGYFSSTIFGKPQTNETIKGQFTPIIWMNTNYIYTEKQALCVLIHEMVHFKQYICSHYTDSGHKALTI